MLPPDLQALHERSPSSISRNN